MTQAKLHLAPPSDHTDWMFDNGVGLWTWASDTALPPHDQPFNDRRFEKLFDHRREYLDYEGPVSNDRGQVTRIEQGHYELVVHNEERFEGFTKWRTQRRAGTSAHA